MLQRCKIKGNEITYYKPTPIDGREIIKIIDNKNEEENLDINYFQSTKFFSCFRKLNLNILSNINVSKDFAIENNNYIEFLNLIIKCINEHIDLITSITLIESDDIMFKKYMKYKNKYIYLKNKKN
jgi:hypothetical protein